MAKLLLLGLVASASAFIAPQTSTRGLTVVSVSRPQLKAAKKANRLRPKKSRPSDINRKAPEYPPIPDIPWMTKIDKNVCFLLLCSLLTVFLFSVS